MATIDQVLVQVAAIQKTITAPTGQELRDAYAKPPALITVFPVFLNLVERVGIEQSVGLKEDFLTVTVGMHLLMGSIELAESYQQAMAWIKPTLETFNANPTLNATADGISFLEVRFGEPLRWGQRSYLQATFLMDVFGVS